jgi:hypothetical protein
MNELDFQWVGVCCAGNTSVLDQTNEIKSLTASWNFTGQSLHKIQLLIGKGPG